MPKMAGRFFWAVMVGFLTGVFLRSFVPSGPSVAAFSIVLAAALAVLAPLGFLARARALVAAVALVAVAAGGVRMSSAIIVPDPVLAASVGRESVITGVIAEEPDVRDMQVRIVIAADALGASSTQPVEARMLAVLPAFTAVAYGDRVRVSGMLETPASFETDTGRRFDYAGYLAARGISFQLSKAHVVQQASGQAGFFSYLYGAKRAYLAGTQAVLPEPEAGLANGIVAGDKRSVGPEITDEFTRTSLSHVLVLSGYNITIVAVAAAWLFRRLRRIPRAFLSVGAVVLFVLATGASASAVRAAGMAFVAVYARLSGRRFDALRALGLLCAGMVAWNPYLLVFDPGFQLSALATFGLIVFSPVVVRRARWVPERLGLRELFAATVSTQLAVLPLLLWQSGTLSLVSLPANLLALVAVPPAMLASFVAALGGVLVGSWAVPLAAPAYILLAYIVGVAHVFASLPFSAVVLPAFGAWVLVPAYAIVGALAYRVYTKPAAT